MMRKLSAIGRRSINSTLLRSPAIQITRQFAAVTLEAKEKGDEARYIRQQEELQKAELRKSFEKLLAKDVEPAKIADIMEVLEKPTESKSLLSKLGLDDWRFALPVGLILAIPAITNEIVVINSETQLLAVFILSVFTLYTQAGGVFTAALDDHAKSIEKTLQEIDESILRETKEFVNEAKNLLTVEQDYKGLYQVVDDLSVLQADILNYSAEHKYRDAVVKKLDALVAIEEAVNNTIRKKMISSVTADVVSQFTHDKKFKESALEQAIAALAAGPEGKLGKDVVGGAFQSALKSYRDDFTKKSPELNFILDDLKKDVAAVTTAPVVEGSGGNVYITHPIMRA